MNKFTKDTYIELCKSLSTASKCTASNIKLPLSFLIVDLVEVANTMYIYDNSGKALNSIEDIFQWEKEFGKFQMNFMLIRLQKDNVPRSIKELYKKMTYLRNTICHNPSARSTILERSLALSDNLEEDLLNYFRWLRSWVIDDNNLKISFDYEEAIRLVVKTISSTSISKIS